ncbi:MAG: hypothetical protein U9Q79_11955 [Candidatus Hydrogenedentes bacterium]|nr:hypothetical protein [Candidatus Hydrogenedentota bacterium]
MDQIDAYLRKRALLAPWRVECKTCVNIECAVVIPALAERRNILDTLRSLAANPLSQLQRTLVVVVVNNRPPGVARPEDIADNQETLELLRGMLQGDRSEGGDVIDAGLRLAYIDASSPGLEFPAKGGVGLARKIGLDAALRALHEAGVDEKAVLLSTDADTLVEPNYLEAVRHHFQRTDAWAAIVAYAHRFEGSDAEIAAILAYETHLRYHTIGLRMAGSPYAYSTVGSTIVCSARAYVAAGGMNRRQAGEDFYFLQQLAKTGRVEALNATTVHPSPRASHRVPFGTGRWVQQRLDGKQDLLTYHPESYRILSMWLSLVNNESQASPETILAQIRQIHAPAADFLAAQGFANTWEKLRRNSPNQHVLLEQFHRWFDAFKTLKLLHHLLDNGYPLQPLWSAVRTLLDQSGYEPAGFPWQRAAYDREVQITLLHHLRRIEHQA